MKRIFYFLFISIILVACQTIFQEGQDLYKKELYAEALQKFEKAKRRDPNDAEIKLWLAKTRQAIIDRGLIEVRFLRLGGNHEAALNKLEAILRNQEKWQIKYTSALSETQEKETKEANNYLESLIGKAHKEAKPMSVKWLEYKYKKTITSGKANHFIESLLPDMQKLAQTKCRNLEAQVGPYDFYFAKSVRKFCSFWNIDTQIKLNKKDPSRFSNIVFNNKISNLDSRKINLNDLENKLSKTFKKSFFYYPEAEQSFVIFLDGNASYHKSSFFVSKNAHYSEPYRTYKRQSKSVYNEHLKKYVNKTVEVPVTRYRPRVYSYQVLRYKESLQINSSLRANLLKEKLSFNANINKENETESSQASFPPAEVYPVTPKFLAVDKHVNSVFNNLSSQFSFSLEKSWKSLFCHSSATNPLKEQEWVHRCEQINRKSDKVKLWYKKNLGVTAEQYQKIISN